MSSQESRVLNYIARYAPSKQKILNYLQKLWIQEREFFLVSIRYDESLMGDMWMRTCIALWKSMNDIRQKLLKKWFPRDLIDSKIESYASELRDWEEYRPRILSRIESLREKSKSRRVIAQSLVSMYPYFRDQIMEYLEALDDTSTLQKEVQKYKKRYNEADFSERQKLYRALQAKGFSYKDIKNILENNHS